MKKRIRNLYRKYQPSTPCSCDICVHYCSRPGWWTVEECKRIITDGMAGRIMLEISPDFSFGVLSPAFKGNEGFYALQKYAENGCTFLNNQRCDLYGTSLQPLECRFCHHERKGMGSVCHRDIEKDWNSHSGHKLVLDWLDMMHLPYFHFAQKIDRLRSCVRQKNTFI